MVVHRARENSFHALVAVCTSSSTLDPPPVWDVQLARIPCGWFRVCKGLSCEELVVLTKKWGFKLRQIVHELRLRHSIKTSDCYSNSS